MNANGHQHNSNADGCCVKDKRQGNHSSKQNTNITVAECYCDYRADKGNYYKPKGRKTTVTNASKEPPNRTVVDMIAIATTTTNKPTINTIVAAEAGNLHITTPTTKLMEILHIKMLPEKPGMNAFGRQCRCKVTKTSGNLTINNSATTSGSAAKRILWSMIELGTTKLSP